MRTTQLAKQAILLLIASSLSGCIWVVDEDGYGRGGGHRDGGERGKHRGEHHERH